MTMAKVSRIIENNMEEEIMHEFVLQKEDGFKKLIIQFEIIGNKDMRISK